MVELSDVAFRYADGDFRLALPRLVVRRGETVALIGPSGIGKTTLLQIIAGVRTPEAGRSKVNGVELQDLDDSRRRAFRIRSVGLVFQEFALLEHLNVLDNILLPYRIHSALRLDRSARERACALAERVGIGDKLRRYATRLSQGEMQRVAVCRALIADPPLLLADEPTGNLDPDNTKRVLDTLFATVSEQGTTLVAVTHDHENLGRFDRVIDFRDLREAKQAPGAAGSP